MNEQTILFRKILAGLVIFSGLGIVGALPAGMIGLMGGAQVASDMYVLAALILGSWLPLKILVDHFIKGPSNIPIPSSFSFATIFVIGFALLVAVPFLYMMTITAFLAGIFAYLVTQNSLMIALIAAFVVQTVLLVRSSQNEKEQGSMNSFFVRFNDINMAQNYDISIDAQSSRVAEQAYDDEPDVLFLPAERLQEVDDDDDDEGMTISIDSQSEEDKS